MTPTTPPTPDPSPPSRDTLVRCTPDQLPRARAIAAASALNVVAVACDAPRERIAEAFPTAEPFSDARHALATAPAAVALFLTDAELLDDPDTIDRAHDRGITLLTTEPWPSSIESTRDLADTPPNTTPIFIPQFRATPIAADIIDAAADLGPARTLALSTRCAPIDGSLAARLFDAMLLAHALLGLPETIDAAHVPADPRATPGATPQALRNLHGDCGVTLRYASRRAAVISCSNHAGPWFRGCTIVAERGAIRATEHGMERYDTSGALLDASPPRIPDPDPGLRAIAEAIDRALDPRIPLPPPADIPEVLAMCHAALLSARTAQAEPPATLLRMATRA